jgi:hypothetical protein
MRRKVSPILAQMATWGDQYMRRYDAARKSKAIASQ